MYTVLPDTIKLADTLAVQQYGISPLTLMKSAANSALQYIYPHLSQNSVITILCGKGNNGGDGYEIAHILANDGYDVGIVNVFDTPPETDEALSCYNSCISQGIAFINVQNSSERIKNSSIIVDAVFGVGFRGSIEYDSVCGKLFKMCDESSAFKIAIDTPSGINSADGTVQACAFKAHLTIAISLIKTGLVTYPAKMYCNDVVKADICFPEELIKSLPTDALLADDEYISNTIPKRNADSHKGTYGKLTMICGSPLMTGAPYLACMAALRTGAGLVTMASDSKTLSVLQNRLTECVFYDIKDISDSENLQQLLSLCDSSNAVLLGCGLGNSPQIQQAVRYIIKNTKSKLIIDADGINALKGHINILREAKQVPVITPHPAEFSRICGESVEQIQSNRLNCTKSFSREYNCITILKGACTVICSPDGKTAINTTGNPGLSKGGSGDVLAGAVSSFICQGIETFDACVCAVYLHGKSADILSQTISQYGLLPSDLPLGIAKLLP